MLLTKTSASSFIAQPDTPGSYSGQTGLFPRVNAGEDALEFAAAGLSAHALDGVDHTAKEGIVKAYCSVASDGTLQANSFNITSTTRTATGRYLVTFDTDFANANYAVAVGPELGARDFVFFNNILVGSIQVWVLDPAGSDVDQAFHVIAIGDQ